MMRKKKYEVTILLVIIFIAALLRLWNLGTVPGGVTNDEATIIYNAYSIFKTGRDVTGKFLPLSTQIGSSFSPICLYLTAPFVGLMGVSPFTGRLPFALMGIASVPLLYILGKKIGTGVVIALASSFILAISPWHIHISRIAYDGHSALFFYLLALVLFIKNVKQGTILWSLPFFLFGFYSYHATKIFFLAVIPVLLFIYRHYLFDRKKHTRSELLLFSAGIVSILLSFMVVVQTQKVTRQAVLIWNNNENATQTVDWERKTSSAPTMVKKIFNNKLLYYLRMARENYFEALSPQFLFLYGETGGLAGIYGVSFRGVMYFIELPLLLMGIFYWVTSKDRNAKLVIFVLLLIAPLCSTFTRDRSFVIRNAMMLPPLALLTGTGLVQVIKNSIGKNVNGKLFLILFGFIYIFMVTGYLYQYHFRYAIYSAENWLRSTRELTEYVGQRRGNYRKVFIVTSDAPALLLHYALYNKADPRVVQAVWYDDDYRIDNVEFITGCVDTNVFDPKKQFPVKTLYVTPESCHNEAIPMTIIYDRSEPLKTVWKLFES